MRNKTCCFTGHRKIPQQQYNYIRTALTKNIIELVNRGVIYFGSGGGLGFDTIAAQTVLSLKKEYPHIKLIMVYPCQQQTKFWSKKDIQMYEDIKLKCDKYIYVSENYSRGCMQKRNRHLVNHSGYCLCYLTQETGGTAYTVSYAGKNNLEIINIAKTKNS